jgi:hypothetical protein
MSKPDENKPNIDIELLVKELQAEMANVVTQLQQEKVERQHLQDQLVQILQRII